VQLANLITEITMLSRNQKMYGAVLLIAALGLATVAYMRHSQPIETRPEQSLAVTDLPDFAAIEDATAKKRAFFAYLYPYIEKENREILMMREEVEAFRDELVDQGRLSSNQLYRLQQIAVRYRTQQASVTVDSLNELLHKLDILPPRMVLVQAANESAWGTSRFARQGYNLFGLWCFQPGCGMVPLSRNEDASHEVASFETLDEAVSAYFLNLNTHPSYQPMRELRAQARASANPINARSLLPGMIHYSERGEEYIEDLQSMLRHNDRLLAEL
jgi:Bax protein